MRYEVPMTLFFFFTFYINHYNKYSTPQYQLVHNQQVMSSLASHAYFHILIINVCAAEGGGWGGGEEKCMW